MNRSGFSLVEIVFVIALLAILGTITFTSVTEQVDSSRYTETKAKMDAIRTAILGEDTVDEQGHRSRFGYLGDMGNFPVALSSLTAQGSQPTWTYDTYHGFGSGWRGPYIQEQFTTSLQVDLDAWGNSFVYTTTPIPSITSRGADRAVGGAMLDKDLAMTISTNMYLSSVQGIVADGPLRIGTANVEIRYPVQGVQTTVTSSSTASGTFTFNTVPYGVRSLRVTGPSPVPAFGPTRVVVDRQFTLVPEHTMDLAGTSKVTLSSVGVVTNTVSVNVNSAYRTPMVIDHIVLSHSSAETLTSFNVTGSGGAETPLPNIPSGFRYNPIGNFTVNPGASTITLVFTGASMAGVNYVLTIYWTSPGRRDTIQFSS